MAPVEGSGPAGHADSLPGESGVGALSRWVTMPSAGLARKDARWGLTLCTHGGYDNLLISRSPSMSFQPCAVSSQPNAGGRRQLAES